MHSFTGGRFTLGIGRGVDRLWDAMGLPHITTAQMEDFAGLAEAPCGRGRRSSATTVPRVVALTSNLDGIEGLDIPLGLVAAFGPNSLQLGGLALRPSRVAHLLHRRDHGARGEDGEATLRAGRS